MRAEVLERFGGKLHVELQLHARLLVGLAVLLAEGDDVLDLDVGRLGECEHGRGLLVVGWVRRCGCPRRRGSCGRGGGCAASAAPLPAWSTRARSRGTQRGRPGTSGGGRPRWRSALRA